MPHQDQPSESRKSECNRNFTDFSPVLPPHYLPYLKACYDGKNIAHEVPICWYKHALADHIHWTSFGPKYCCKLDFN